MTSPPVWRAASRAVPTSSASSGLTVTVPLRPASRESSESVRKRLHARSTSSATSATMRRASSRAAGSVTTTRAVVLHSDHCAVASSTGNVSWKGMTSRPAGAGLRRAAGGRHAHGAAVVGRGVVRGRAAGAVVARFAVARFVVRGARAGGRVGGRVGVRSRSTSCRRWSLSTWTASPASRHGPRGRSLRSPRRRSLPGLRSPQLCGACPAHAMSLLLLGWRPPNIAVVAGRSL